MLIEFQTTGTNYLYQFRERLKGMSLALTDEQRDAAGRVMVVNRLIVGNGTQLRSEKSTNFEVRLGAIGLTVVAGKQMQIVQPITIELVYLDDLIASSDAPASVTPLQIWIVLDVSLSVVGGAAFLNIDYDSVMGFLPPDVLSALDARLRTLIKPQSSPVDLASVQDMVAGAPIVNAGIACRPGTGGPGNVAMRIELGSADAGAQSWARFFRGEYDDLLATPGNRSIPAVAPAERWAMFLDKTLLERFVTGVLTDGFTDSKDVKLRSDISVSWSNPGGEARLDASFKAIAINACDLGPLGEYDIRLDVQIPITLSVPNDNTLRQHLKLNYWKNDLDTAACIVGASVFFPIIGAARVSAGKLRWDYYAWLVVVVPARFIAATIAANSTTLEPPNPTLKKVSDDEFESDQPFSAAPLVLLNYHGLSSGLVLMGRQPAAPDTCPALIDAGHCGFDFKPPYISCSDVAGSNEADLTHRFLTSVHGSAVARAENVGERACQSPNKVRLQNWGWRFLDDALAQQLQIQVKDDEYIDYSVLELTCPIPSNDYYANPRSVQLLLKTNGGARVFTYGLPKLSQDEIAKLSALGAIAAINRCEQLVDPWWQHFHHYNPRWSVDPPFRVSPEDRQVWVFTFAGLQPGDAMTASVNQQRMMSARANERGRATLTVMTSGAVPPEVTLEHTSAALHASLNRGEVSTHQEAQMFMSQTALAPIADIELSAPIEQLFVRRRAGNRTLYAIHADGFSVVDISAPANPIIVAEHRGDELRGATFDGDEIVMFGGTRPMRLAPIGGIPRRDACDRSETPVVRALVAGRDFFVVRERSVDVFDRHLCRVRRLHLDRAVVTATLAGERVVLGGPRGLTVLDPSQRDSNMQHFDMPTVTAVSAPGFAVPTDSILVRTAEHVGLYELRPQGLVHTAEIDEEPWFAGVSTFDSYVATTVATRVSIGSIVGRIRWCSV